MKISIFDNWAFLVEYLHSQEELISILDFTRTEKLRTTVSNEIVNPHCFTSKEKQKIVNEYVEVIYELGKFNNFSLHWLCHPISEKNDLDPNNLLLQIVDYLSFIKFVSKFKEEKLTVLTDNKWLVKNIIDFSNKNQIRCEYIKAKSPRKSFQSKCRTFVTRCKFPISTLREFRLFRYRLSCSLKSRFLLKKLDMRRSYTVIRTWFDHRSKSLINHDRDVYFGKLPYYLKRKGESILFFGGTIDQVFDYKKDFNNPLLLENSLLDWLDYLKVLFFKLITKHKIKFKNQIIIQDINVRSIFENYFNVALKNGSADSNYLSYLAVKKLLKNVKIVQFFNLFENYGWEKVTTLAIKESSKSIKLIAFQHAQVAMSSTKFFLGSEESRYTPLPDKIVTLGKVTRDFLVNEKNYPADIMVIGCALRHDYRNLNGPVHRNNHNRILVSGWTFERSIEMLNFLNNSKIFQDTKYTITVRTHPNHPFDKLKPHLNFKYSGDFKISNDSLKNNFNNADIVVYSGSTICLDALAFGLPVVNVEFDDFFSPDPLFDFKDFKWTVREPEELVTAFESISRLTDDEYYFCQAEAYNFVRKYFYSVNDQNLKVFLD